jgi:hypothetical protein
VQGRTVDCFPLRDVTMLHPWQVPSAVKPHLVRVEQFQLVQRAVDMRRRSVRWSAAGSGGEEAMSEHALERWHAMVRAHDPSGLATLLDEDAVFHSPIVHSPQPGRELVTMYLTAAFQVFFNPTFRYVREIVGPSDAMLEFETVLDGIVVNGVDIIRWNDAGRIVDFKVMIRPLKAINLIHERMAAMLQTLSTTSR